MLQSGEAASKSGLENQTDVFCAEEEEWHSKEKKHPKQKHGGVLESGVFGGW